MENQNKQIIDTRLKVIKAANKQEKITRFIVFAVVIILWQLIALRIKIPLIWPTAPSIAKGLVNSVTDPETLKNLGITFVRVIKGWLVAMAMGIPIGLGMGLSKGFNNIVSGMVNALRQVPMMAWVPLTIIWFGIGDGPTIFMIAINGVFQVILNTANGVNKISDDFFNAARSMGAGRVSIFRKIVIPGSLPDILVASRLAIGAGWMSVM